MRTGADDGGIDRGIGSRADDSTSEEPLDAEALVEEVLGWYREQARDLPWRSPQRDPWGVLVSEVMLQQTPVVRVLPVWLEWMQRWPQPADLAAAPTADLLRAWGRLGYPRRALRLQQAARAIVERHDGAVPSDHGDLLALPGIGEYTAAAVASFAFGQRHLVLDTNVRRVLARVLGGQRHPGPAPTRAERERAATLLPPDPARAAEWAVAVMELGALVCRSSTPDCERCPIATRCRWLAAGRPEWSGPPRRGQAWAGTDRQCRGRLMARLRESEQVDESELVARCHDRSQAVRCLESLIEDGLAIRSEEGISLPR